MFPKAKVAPKGFTVLSFNRDLICQSFKESERTKEIAQELGKTYRPPKPSLSDKQILLQRWKNTGVSTVRREFNTMYLTEYVTVKSVTHKRRKKIKKTQTGHLRCNWDYLGYAESATRCLQEAQKNMYLQLKLKSFSPKQYEL